MFKLLLTPHIKQRIEEKKHLILPKTWWSGVKKEVERLELIDNDKKLLIKDEEIVSLKR